MDEFAEFTVGNGNDIDPECIDRHAMDWRLARILPVRPHEEGAAENPHHTSVSVELYRRTVRPRQCDSIELRHDPGSSNGRRAIPPPRQPKLAGRAIT